MSHQRFPSEAVKEPHSVSLKVLRLVTQLAEEGIH